MNDQMKFVELKPHSSMIAAHDRPYTRLRCTGIFFFKNTQLSKQILSDWWNCSGKLCTEYFHEHSYEQKYFNHVVFKKYQQNISVTEDYSFTNREEAFWKHAPPPRPRNQTKKIDALQNIYRSMINSMEMTANITEIIQIIKTKHTVQMYDDVKYHVNMTL